MNFFEKIGESLYKTLIENDNYMLLLKGLGNTLLLAFFAIIIGIVIGVIVAIGKVASADNKKLFIIKWLCNIYINTIRGTPVYVQMLIIYFCILPLLQSRNAMLAGAVTFGVNSGAYVAEIIRAGILSIDKGQSEAGRSLGLGQFQTMKLIVMPQAIKNILPALGNEFIVLIKETAIVGNITVYDLTKSAERISSFTFDVFTPLLVISLVYLIVVLGLTKLLNVFERRLAKSDRR